MTAEETFDKWCDTSQPMDLYVVKMLAITAMKEYARIKCLEAIKNTRYSACEIIEEDSYYLDTLTLSINVQDALRKIQNIPNEDVMPVL